MKKYTKRLNNYYFLKRKLITKFLVITLMILYPTSNFIIFIIPYMLFDIDPFGSGYIDNTILVGMFLCGVFIPYFILSERVKNTFIN